MRGLVECPQGRDVRRSSPAVAGVPGRAGGCARVGAEHRRHRRRVAAARPALGGHSVPAVQLAPRVCALQRGGHPEGSLPSAPPGPPSLSASACARRPRETPSQATPLMECALCSHPAERPAQLLVHPSRAAPSRQRPPHPSTATLVCGSRGRHAAMLQRNGRRCPRAGTPLSAQSPPCDCGGGGNGSEPHGAARFSGSVAGADIPELPLVVTKQPRYKNRDQDER